MGWWKIRDVETGGIDWGHQSQGLVNAVQGDHRENYYNGDEPADLMDGLLGDLRPYRSKLCLNKAEIIGVILGTLDCEDEVRETIDAVWRTINEVYLRVWGRPTYPEERAAIINFCMGGEE